MNLLLKSALVACALFSMHGAASAQKWGFVANSAPATGVPLAFASVGVGDPREGWRLVAWCEKADAKQVNWQIRVQTRNIISAYRSTDVVMRFDDRRPTQVAAPLTGDYSNFAVLVRSEDANLNTLHTWLNELKTSGHLAIQIGKTERVFPMNGATTALDSWANHCQLA